MGCAGAKEQETDNFSNQSAEEVPQVQGHLYSEDWFREYFRRPDFEKLWQELTKDTNGELVRQTVIDVANSALILTLEDAWIDNPRDIPVLGDILRNLRYTFHYDNATFSLKAKDKIRNRMRMRNTEALDVVFDTIDTDKSGTISREELTSMFNIIKYVNPHAEAEPTAEDIEQCFTGIFDLVSKVVDPNGNGKISPEELQHVVDMLLANVSQIYHLIITVASESIEGCMMDQDYREIPKDAIKEEVLRDIQPNLEAFGLWESTAGLMDLAKTHDVPEEAPVPPEIIAAFRSIEGNEVDAARSALEGSDNPMAPIFGVGAVAAHIGLGLMVSLVEMVNGLKGCSKADFNKEMAGFFSDKGKKALHQCIEISKDVAKHMLSMSADQWQEMQGYDLEEPQKEFLKIWESTDVKKIVDRVFDIASQHAGQIYDALFEVAMCGRSGTTLDERTVDAVSSVVLGGPKVCERFDLIFAAFDHNGNGIVEAAEIKALIRSLCKLYTGFAHDLLTTIVTFSSHYLLRACVERAFEVVAEDEKELKIENALCFLCVDRQSYEVIGPILGAKYKIDQEECQKRLGKMQEKLMALSDGESPNSEEGFAKMMHAIGLPILEKLAKVC